MHPPAFWQAGGGAVLPVLLSPAAWFVASATARRLSRPGWRAPAPVICCGNATVGGAGKTTLALDLAARLLARGARPHCLTRGHGGTARGPLRVDPSRHQAAQVGDEPLLLAAVAPTWLGADRAATARLAVQEGATHLILDDGLQNPTLHKDCSLLVIDGAAGFGNNRVLPSGPLREPVASAAARAHAAVLIGPDAAGALALLPPSLPVLRAHLAPAPDIAAHAGRRVVAFAGIGRPEKFFRMLESANVRVDARLPFADHHAFTPRDLARIHAEAARGGNAIVTTPKDFVRLATADRPGIVPIGVHLRWDNPDAIDATLAGLAA